jgi:hypothetical protein
MVFVSKYVQLNNMVISNPCCCFFFFLLKNSVRGSVKMFRVRNGSMAKLNWETLLQILGLFTRSTFEVNRPNSQQKAIRPLKIPS